MSQYCIYEHHNEGKIIGVCLLNCQKQRALCSTCLQYFHINHAQNFVLDFNGLKQNLQEKITTFRKLKSLQNEFNQLKSVLDDYIVKCNIETQEYNFQSYTLSELSTLTGKLIYLGLIEQSIQPLKKLIQDMQHYIKSAKELSRSEQNQIAHIIQSPDKIRFSNQLKSDNINIKNEESIASTSDDNLGFVLCETGVNKNSEVQQFAFKILEKDWIAIGICHKDQIQSNKRKFDISDNSEHGCYLIDSQGKVFSPGENNNRKNNFSLKKDDIIIVKVDRTNKTVLWIDYTKKQQLQIMEFDISQCICPVVCLRKSAVQVNSLS